MGISAILLAAGRGVRFGADKTQILLRGRPIWHYAYQTLRRSPSVDEVIVVVSAENEQAIRALAHDADVIVLGGSSRAESSRIGVEASTKERVIIHDAARPFVSLDVIARVVGALEHATAVTPFVPVVDTIKHVDGGRVTTLNRDQLIATQTPQGAWRNVLLKAYDEARQEFTDEMSLMETIGIQPHLVPGDPANFKVTNPDDLLRAAGYLGAPEIRTGLGYDIHPFAQDERPMMLGGVAFEGRGLEGHSDADVLLHAVTDAVLGSAALGDIGQHFPNSDPQWRGAASGLFLQHAARLVRESGWDLINIDATIIAEQPKIMVKAFDIRSSIADLVGLDVSRVSIKATTNEQLGALGRSEGIAAFAVATVRQTP